MYCSISILEAINPDFFPSIRAHFQSALKDAEARVSFILFCRIFIPPIRVSGLPDFSLFMIPKPEKNVPNEHKMYQMVIKYPKCLYNIPNGPKIYQHIPI
jgi:hypothetical protein